MTKKLCVLYGWAEGPKIAQAFLEAATDSGFLLSSDVHLADIIVAHSAGCYAIPKDSKQKLVLLNGLPFWPGKFIVKSLLEKVKRDYAHHKHHSAIGYWTYKTMWNSYYSLRHPLYSLNMWRHWRQQAVPAGENFQKIIAIRNQHDSFCTPANYQMLAAKYGWQFMELSGEHDDIWSNPGPYIDLLKRAL